MTARFQFLEDIALADAAFQASGDSPAELFQAAAQATIETMVDPSTVSPVSSHRIHRDEETLEDLLFDWLEEIVYLKDAKGLVFLVPTVNVSREPSTGRWRLDGTLEGEPIDPTRHHLRSDVKAVTKHMYEIRQDGGQWLARVVLDI